MGWGALGCSNLTASGARGGIARDVTKKRCYQLVASAGELEVLKVRLGVRFPLATTNQYEWTEKGDGLGCIGL